MLRVRSCSAKAPALRTLRFALDTRARRISPAISNAALAPRPHATPGDFGEDVGANALPPHGVRATAHAKSQIFASTARYGTPSIPSSRPRTFAGRERLP